MLQSQSQQFVLGLCMPNLMFMWVIFVQKFDLNLKTRKFRNELKSVNVIGSQLQGQTEPSGGFKLMLQSLDEGPRGKREFNLKQDLQLGWKFRKLWQEYRKRVSLVDFQNIFSSHRILLTPTKNLKTIRLTSQSNVLNISKWHISRKWEARWRKCRIISVILLSGLCRCLLTRIRSDRRQSWES